ncbi:MAG: HAD family phosphatase [Anaerolineales bacterium]|nr:HAD family phosphatase [Anaerolineales bacterium]
MAIKAVIWDLGGVLVRTEDRAPRRRLAERYGMTSRELERLVFQGEMGDAAQLGAVTAEQLWGYVADQIGAPRSETKALEAGFWGGDRLDEDLIETIRGLRTDYTVGLLSNAWDSLRDALETRFGIEDVFDPVVISAEVGLMKPDPKIYRLALDEAGAAPEEAVFLDDFPENVAGARAVGMHAVHFDSKERALAELIELLKY